MRYKFRRLVKAVSIYIENFHFRRPPESKTYMSVTHQGSGDILYADSHRRIAVGDSVLHTGNVFSYTGSPPTPREGRSSRLASGRAPVFRGERLSDGSNEAAAGARATCTLPFPYVSSRHQGSTHISSLYASARSNVSYAKVVINLTCIAYPTVTMVWFLSGLRFRK